jgi:hypothetical protein
MLNWRYWIVYDEKDIDDSLFKDYNPNLDSEEYEAVKFMKDNKYMN